MGTTPGSAPNVVIRRSTAKEWVALREMRLRALRLDPLAFGSTFDEEVNLDSARWRERARSGATSTQSCQLVAAGPDGRLVGSVVVAEAEGELNVFAMWVDPAARGRGTGGRLLDAALKWTTETFPGRSLRLEVNPRQREAVRLYESRGFLATGSSRPLGHTAGETRIEMVWTPPRVSEGTRSQV